jgi:hypothetical protein
MHFAKSQEGGSFLAVGGYMESQFRVAAQRLAEIRETLSTWKGSVYAIETTTLRALIEGYRHACECGGVFVHHTSSAEGTSAERCPDCKRMTVTVQPGHKISRIVPRFTPEIEDTAAVVEQMRTPLLGPGDK